MREKATLISVQESLFIVFGALSKIKRAILLRIARLIFSGGKGAGLEPNQPLSFENEDFLLLIKDLLDAVEAMEKSTSNKEQL